MDRLKFKVFQDKRDQWRWHLIAGNGRIIADSAESYHNKQDCLKGVDLVKNACQETPVEVDE